MARDDDTADLKKAPTAQAIRKRWDEGEDDTAAACRSYWVNSCFVTGKQWIHWDKVDRTVVGGTRDAERQRITINRIRPAMNSLTGRLTAKPLRFEDRPTAADDATVAGAKLGENVLNTAHDVQDWESVRAAEIRYAYYGHVSLVYLDWDGAGGEVLEYDEANEKVVGTGEIQLAALPITDFRLAPGVRDGYKSPYWISGIAMPVDEAKRRWKLKKKPEPDALMGRSAIQRQLLANSGRGDSDSCLVLTYWQPPSEESGDGWVATVIGEEIVGDGPHDWPFPFKEQNFALFPQFETDVWTADTVLNDAIAPQYAYNCLWSANVEAAKLAGTPYLAMDSLTVDLNDDTTDEPGSTLEYPVGSNPPLWVTAPGPSRGLLNLVGELDRILDDALSSHAVSRGDVNVNRTPASSIAQLAEKDDTPLGRFAHMQAAGWSRLGRLILKTYEDKVTELREVPVMAQGSAVATSRWNGEMLRGQTDVSVPLEVTKPFSRVAARLQATELIQILPPGTIAPAKLMEMWDIDPEDSLETLYPDVARAKRENVKLMAGTVCYPAMFDNHGVHMSEHNAFRKSAAYEEAHPQIKMLIDDHVKTHEMFEAEQMNAQLKREQAMQGAAGMAQADEPPLSRVPPPLTQQQAQLAPMQFAGPPGP